MSEFADPADIAARLEALAEEYRVRQRKFLATFALVVGSVLIAFAVLIFGLKVMEPTIGGFVLLGAMVLGGFVLVRRLSGLALERGDAMNRILEEKPLY